MQNAILRVVCKIYENKVTLFNIDEFNLQNLNSSILRDKAIRMQSEECEYRDNLCVRFQSYAHIHGAYSLDNFPTLKKWENYLMIV